MTMPPKSPVAVAMGFFGRLPDQGLAAFRDEWNKLSDEVKRQLSDGITDGSLTYPDPE